MRKVLCYLFYFRFETTTIKLLVIMYLTFVSGGCILLGVIIYGYKQASNDYYGCAFILCIIAAIVSLVSGVFTVLDLRTGTTTG